MNAAKARQGQFTLLQFLLWAVAAGALLGFAWPLIRDLLQPPAPTLAPARSSGSETRMESDVYFESAETPLD